MKQLQKARIDEFKAHFRGDVLLPGDAGYDEVRQIWNAMIDRRPALIARCASPEDVVQAVTFARRHDLLVSIRGGGHNIAGNAVCDDGLMIDLSLMKGVKVDLNARRATVEPGCTLGDFDAVFVLAGVQVAAINISNLNVLLEFAPGPAEQPTYVGLGTTLMAPVAFGAPLAAGLLADTAGFSAVFVAATGAGAVGLGLLVWRVSDPRHLRRAMTQTDQL